MTHVTTLATATLCTPSGQQAQLGIDHRPQHPDPFARYLAHAVVDGVPWSACCRDLATAQAQARAWRDCLTTQYGYVLCDPFGLPEATDAQRHAAQATGSYAAQVCDPNYRHAREI